MRILLPPSETKRLGTRATKLDLSKLSFNELAVDRLKLLSELARVSAQKNAPERIGIPKTLQNQLIGNVEIWQSPTSPAIEIYDGVLFDALDFSTLSTAAKARALGTLVITSAAFGFVGAGDLIPAYRLSATSKLLRNQTLSSYWKSAMTKIDFADELIIDLRSGSYENFWIPKDPANYLRIKIMELNATSGRKQAVSHFNKATKGQLARALVQSRKVLSTPDQAKQYLESLGWEVVDETIDRNQPRTVEVLTRG